MTEFLEDELKRPFEHALAWTPDGRGVEVCVGAQAMRIPAHTEVEDGSGSKVRLVDRIIRTRLMRTGTHFTKRLCEHCGGFHLEQLNDNEVREDHEHHRRG